MSFSAISYYGTGFVLLIEDYLIDQKGKTRKTYVPVSFGSRLFITTQLNFFVFFKLFLSLYFAVDHFAHFFWGATKPGLVLTDNRSLRQFSSVKCIHPSLWKRPDGVLFFNILLAHILRKANSAADFLPRMQTDPNLTLQIKLTDLVPAREIEIESEAKAPDIFCSTIGEIAPFSEEIHPVVDEHLINQIKTLGLFDQFLAKQPKDDPDINLTGLDTFSSLPQVTLIGKNDFEVIFNDFPNRTEPLDMVHKQQNDEIIREVISWKNRGHPEKSLNL